MKIILSSIPTLISAASFIKKLRLPVAALLLFFCNNLSAGIKPVERDKGSHITKHGINAAITIKRSIEIALPTVSYSGPQTYTAGTAITALLPGGSGVGAIGNVGALVSVGSGFNLPEGMITDGAGNIYVADAGNNAVKKMPAGGRSTINGRMQQPGTYFYSPDYVADRKTRHKTGFIILKF